MFVTELFVGNSIGHSRVKKQKIQGTKSDWNSHEYDSTAKAIILSSPIIAMFHVYKHCNYNAKVSTIIGPLQNLVT